jgi:hypothetical protein
MRKQAEFEHQKKEIALLEAELGQQKRQFDRLKNSIKVSHKPEIRNPENKNEVTV